MANKSEKWKISGKKSAFDHSYLNSIYSPNGQRIKWFYPSALRIPSPTWVRSFLHLSTRELNYISIFANPGSLKTRKVIQDFDRKVRFMVILNRSPAICLNVEKEVASITFKNRRNKKSIGSTGLETAYCQWS